MLLAKRIKHYILLTHCLIYWLLNPLVRYRYEMRLTCDSGRSGLVTRDIYDSTSLLPCHASTPLNYLLDITL